ncbi:MAG: nucleotidyltransferase [Clostridiaceae bacterium]|nr:nucleotidyltransferase [Clostridiaceae bacterium]
MKVLGIVSEYNPLHEGHIYHIRASVEKTGATHTVCVMSGNFVQRGEPSVVDKWVRTKMALHAGIDLVLELPVVFACASAELFAYGAVRTLHNTGVVDYLSFGSEQGELGSLWRIASVLNDEPYEFRELLAKYLDEGHSFPVSREKALHATLRGLPENILSKSNNILAIEYLKALKRLGSSIQPVTVKRMGASYLSTEISSSYSSATAIRKFLQTGGSVNDPLLMDNLPDFTAELIKDEIERQRGPVFDKAFSDIILHKLRMIEPERLREVPDVTEGLENRLISCAMQSGTLSDFIDRVSTSRYPSTRVKRIAMNLLWGITKDELRSFVSDETCGYLRVLGFSSNGRDLLARIHKEAGLPLITKVSEYRNLLSGLSRKMFEYDIKATNSYVLAFPAPAQRAGDQDFTMPIIKLN